ncbi:MULTISPECIES: hypothetical protein [unclassified Mycobacterium]|uniref:hypothetical protein n=1 Tax=unclassified Mycobacterium TaxID=2642494 RepID=UPI0025700EC8|nr:MULTISPECIES: hypothetical protein [unclassified Mycobacterium]
MTGSGSGACLPITAVLSLNAAAIWRAFPKDPQTQLRAHLGEPLTDDLLRRCGRVIDDHDLPVSWRPDPASDYAQHTLHPELISTH